MDRNEIIQSDLDGLIIVFDVTKKKSYYAAARLCLDLCELQVPTILLGNKSDLNFKRAIHQQEAEDLAVRANSLYFEVSAKEVIIFRAHGLTWANILF